MAFLEKLQILFFLVNLFILAFILKENKYLYSIINKKFENKIKDSKSIINKDFVGLKYPEIPYDEIKYNLTNENIITTLYEFMIELEKKLIYLEKEINVTKLTSFYTARTLYLQKMKINYDDSKINELHNIINWLVIHKSTQLKGIASDKYLSCQYIKMKLGDDLCTHRIGVYNNINEIDFKKLIDMDNVVLKISNGCHDNVFIRNETYQNINNIKKKLEFSFNRDYGLLIPEFFHLYSKKRIILEKIFVPISDLYEFKILILNQNIKMIYVKSFHDSIKQFTRFDSNFKLISKKDHSNIENINKKLLNKLKTLAIKLSDDFPNFVRVDLYIFQEKIFFSELTFDSNEGMPIFRRFKILKDVGKHWKRIS